MTINKLLFRVKYFLGYFLFNYLRILKYKFLSNCLKVEGYPKYNQPVQLVGLGKITFGKNVNLGVAQSPFFYSSYGYIEARKDYSKVLIGNNVWINNNFSICSEGEGIEIGEDTLIGFNFEVSDSDFHDLHPRKRRIGTPQTEKVIIGKNVFIGSNVKILKGVTIGENSIIANSSVVTKSIPKNVIVGGCPAKVIKKIDFN